MARFRVREPTSQSRGRIWVAVGLALVVVVALLAIWAYLTFLQGTVTVSRIEFLWPNSPCEFNEGNLSGFSTYSGGVVHEELGIPNDNASTCQVSSVTAKTPGFGISNANTPLTIKREQTGTLSFTVDLPKASYSGVLIIDLD